MTIKLTTILAAAFLICACEQKDTAPPPSAEAPAAPSTSTFDPNRGRAMFQQIEKEALADPFVGVRTSEGVQEGLFKISQTGVSTAPIVAAAEALLASLDNEQRANILFDIQDDEWRKWVNIANGVYDRQGVSFQQMSDTQKALGMQMIGASLSAHGLEQTQNIMKTDTTLSELNGNTPYMDEELYFITIMGTPSLTEPWGWQLDGHHLSINYFVLGDQIVFAPVFMGAEPIVTKTGKHAGNVILQEEQNLGLAFMQSLSAEQQAEAMIGDKNNVNIEAGAFSDNKVMDYAGLAVSKLNEDQKQALLGVIAEYIGNIRDGHAEIKMDEVKAHLDDTWFGWRGDTSDDGVFYYRIHSPIVLIEFDHQIPFAVPVPDEDKVVTRDHIHTMVRTPNGNDYGKDLLRQHLEQHDHSQGHSH